MGYTTQFEGRVEIYPPLNAGEMEYINQFNKARHCMRGTGPYDVSDITTLERYNHRDWYDRVYPDKPDYYCPWKATDDGTALVWDGAEKAYGSVDWLQYLIHHFLRPEAIVSQHIKDIERQSDNYERTPATWRLPSELYLFTFDHTLTGGFHAQGEEVGDVWSLAVRENVVTVVEGQHVELPRVITVMHSREQVVEIVQKFQAVDDLVAAREATLAPARAAVDNLRYDYPETDVQHMLDVILSAVIGAGYTVTAPDGETQVEAPF